MGMADGNFSKDEVTKLENNPRFKAMNEDFDNDLFNEKMERGKATKEAAIQTLKDLDLAGQIEALAIVWNILIADGVMTPEEKALMKDLLLDFDIEIESISNRLQQMLH